MFTLYVIALFTLANAYSSMNSPYQSIFTEIPGMGCNKNKLMSGEDYKFRHYESALSLCYSQGWCNAVMIIKSCWLCKDEDLVSILCREGVDNINPNDVHTISSAEQEFYNPVLLIKKKKLSLFITVTSICHKNGGPIGKYFYFDRDEWHAMVEESGRDQPSNMDYKPVCYVDHYRNGQLIRSNVQVITWDHYRNGVHGRKINNQRAGDWQEGDRIRLNREPRFSDYTGRRIEAPLDPALRLLADPSADISA